MDRQHHPKSPTWDFVSGVSKRVYVWIGFLLQVPVVYDLLAPKNGRSDLARAVLGAFAEMKLLIWCAILALFLFAAYCEYRDEWLRHAKTRLAVADARRHDEFVAFVEFAILECRYFAGRFARAAVGSEPMWESIRESETARFLSWMNETAVGLGEFSDVAASDFSNLPKRLADGFARDVVSDQVFSGVADVLLMKLEAYTPYKNVKAPTESAPQGLPDPTRGR